MDGAGGYQGGQDAPITSHRVEGLESRMARLEDGGLKIAETITRSETELDALKRDTDKIEGRMSSWIQTNMGIVGLLLGVTFTLIAATIFLFGGVNDIKDSQRDLKAVIEDNTKTLKETSERTESNFRDLEVLVKDHKHRLDFGDE